MKILFVSNTYTPYKAGVVSSINATIAALQKEGHKVQLLTLDFLGEGHNDPAWVARIPSFIRFVYQQNHMALPWAAYRYIKQAIVSFKPDVVHIHHPFLLGPIAQKVAHDHGIKTIFTYHTQYEQYLHYVPAPQLITRPIVNSLVLNFCKSVDQIIVPSSGIQNYLKKQGIMHAGVLPSALRSDFLEQPFIQKELVPPYRLLYVGRFTKEKNIPFLVDMFASLSNDYELTLVGFGSYTDYLTQYAYQKMKLPKERLRFIVQPSNQALLDYYKNAHLFLFASQTDTQGLVLAESMAFSTPVIALDGIGQRDIIRQGKNGYLVHSLQEMRESIIEICSNNHQYADLQHGAYDTRMRYHGQRLMQELMLHYMRL